jgi:hypothetical protein
MSGYSGTPLLRKLGIRAGMRVRLLGEPDGYWERVGGDAEALGVTDASRNAGDGPADFAHLFATERSALDTLLAAARADMAEDGMIWVSWPKKGSGVASQIDRGEVMAAGKAAGLVDMKVCAVDATWSGLKFVIPVAYRRAGRGRS